MKGPVDPPAAFYLLDNGGKSLLPAMQLEQSLLLRDVSPA